MTNQNQVFRPVASSMAFRPSTKRLITEFSRVDEPEQPVLVRSAAADTEPDTTPREIEQVLLQAPDAIARAQADFDILDRAYQVRLVRLSIEALGRALFAGKKPEDPLRPAANDLERDLAIQQVTGTDADLIRLAESRSAALRSLQQARNKFESARLLAQLIITSQS